MSMDIGQTVSVAIPEQMRSKAKVGSRFQSCRRNWTTGAVEVADFEIDLVDGTSAIATLREVRTLTPPGGEDA